VAQVQLLRRELAVANETIRKVQEAADDLRCQLSARPGQSYESGLPSSPSRTRGLGLMPLPDSDSTCGRGDSLTATGSGLSPAAAGTAAGVSPAACLSPVAWKGLRTVLCSSCHRALVAPSQSL
jgi:hypothetical protein